MQELVAASPSQRNWKGITIAICVILLILASVAVSVVILTPPEEGPRVKGDRFRIDHILDRKFSAPPFNGSWISGRNMLKNIEQIQEELLDVLCVFSQITMFCAPFADNELLFRDAYGGLSILSVDSYNQKQIVSNTTFVSIV